MVEPPIWKICSSSWIISLSRSENRIFLKPPSRESWRTLPREKFESVFCRVLGWDLQTTSDLRCHDSYQQKQRISGKSLATIQMELRGPYKWLKIHGFHMDYNSSLSMEIWTLTFQGTNIPIPKVLSKMILPFPRWDMLVPWRYRAHRARCLVVFERFSGFPWRHLRIQDLWWAIHFPPPLAFHCQHQEVTRACESFKDLNNYTPENETLWT